MRKFSFLSKCSLAFFTLATASSLPLSYTFWSTGKSEQVDQTSAERPSRRPKRSSRFKRGLSELKKSPTNKDVFVPKLSPKKPISSPLVKYDFSKLNDREHSPLANMEADNNYLTFIWSLWRVINSTLWVDQVYGIPWIKSIEAVFPENTFKNEGVSIFIDHESHSFTDETLRELNEFKKADKVSVSLTEEDIQKMKENSNKEAIVQLRHNMGDLFSAFFTENWEPQADINHLTYENTVKTLFTTFIVQAEHQPEDLSLIKQAELRTLRFIRKFGDNFYYLDINFNTKTTANALMVQYVWYKDQSWYKGGYYQANGEYNHYRDQIGGDISLASAQGYPLSEIDEEFSAMFDHIYEKPDVLYKFVLTIKECLEFPECSILFHRKKDDYYTLSQRKPGIPKANSHLREYYKNIHPFANKYYKVEEQMINSPPNQFLFLV